MSTPAPHWTTRAYPVAHRRAHAAEISGLILRVRAEEGRWASFLEQASVLGHALRLRGGLHSNGPAGRALAALVPLVVPVAAVLATTLLVVWRVPALPWDGARAYAPLAYAPWPVVLGCALAGRWTPARIAAGAALAGALLSVPLLRWTGGGEAVAQNQATLVGLALAAVLVLAGPPDLPPTGRAARRTMVLLAPALGIPLLVGSLTVFQAAAGPFSTVDARPDPLRLFFVLTPLVLAVPAALALARVRRGPLAAVALLVAAVLVTVPVGLLPYVPYGSGGLWAQVAFGTGLLALAVAAARAVRERRGTARA